MRKVKTLMRFLSLFVLFVFTYGCKDEVEEVVRYKDILQECDNLFIPDTISFGKLDKKDARYILCLDEPSSDIIDVSKYSFRIDELIQIRTTEDGEKVEITSYSAKTIHNVSFDVYIPDIDRYVTAAMIDSIPGFSKFAFKLSIVGGRTDINLGEGRYASIEYPYIDLGKMKPKLETNDEHYKMLQKIDAKWQCSFSNFDWSQSATNPSWKEMRPIFAREWVVILTNYAYMMSTDEYVYSMTHFKDIFGGDLTDNDSVSFTKEKYLSEIERFKAAKVFKLGRSGDNVGGLGGGSTFGVSDWNYYGHYASYSGWESITHEFMHCMGYSHNSNMTYAKSGIGWTVFMWQLHLWLSYEKKDLPYLDRHLLDFTADSKAEYRDNIGIRNDFKDDAVLEKNRKNYFDNPNQKFIKYFKEHTNILP